MVYLAWFLLFVFCFCFVLVQLTTTFLGVVPSLVGWALSHQSLIEKTAHGPRDLSIGQSNGGPFSTEISSLPMALVCVKLTRKLSSPEPSHRMHVSQHHCLSFFSQNPVLLAQPLRRQYRHVKGNHRSGALRCQLAPRILGHTKFRRPLGVT